MHYLVEGHGQGQSKYIWLDDDAFGLIQRTGNVAGNMSGDIVTLALWFCESDTKCYLWTCTTRKCSWSHFVIASLTFLVPMWFLQVRGVIRTLLVFFPSWTYYNCFKIEQNICATYHVFLTESFCLLLSSRTMLVWQVKEEVGSLKLRPPCWWSNLHIWPETP